MKENCDVPNNATGAIFRYGMDFFVPSPTPYDRDFNENKLEFKKRAWKNTNCCFLLLIGS